MPRVELLLRLERGFNDSQLLVLHFVAIGEQRLVNFVLTLTTAVVGGWRFWVEIFSSPRIWCKSGLPGKTNFWDYN